MFLPDACNTFPLPTAILPVICASNPSARLAAGCLESAFAITPGAICAVGNEIHLRFVIHRGGPAIAKPNRPIAAGGGNRLGELATCCKFSLFRIN